jgi:hypothetical protein
MTGDTHIISRLFQRFGPGKTKPIKQMHGEDVVDAIKRVYPSGYEADIPNGAGGTQTVIVIPMA